MHPCIYMYIDACIHLHVFVSIYIYACYQYVSIYIYTCKEINIYIYVNILWRRVYSHINICIYKCVAMKGMLMKEIDKKVRVWSLLCVCRGYEVCLCKKTVRNKRGLATCIWFRVIHTYAHNFVYKFSNAHIHLRIFTDTHMRTQTHTQTHTHTLSHTHAHTHTHTHTHSMYVAWHVSYIRRHTKATRIFFI